MTDTPAPRRSPFARRTTSDGPRGTLRQLLPYLGEHRPALLLHELHQAVGRV